MDGPGPLQPLAAFIDPAGSATVNATRLIRQSIIPQPRSGAILLCKMGSRPAASAGEGAGSDHVGLPADGRALVATSHGPAAMFMYDDDHGERLVVLTRPMSSANQNAPITPQSQGDVGGFAWADDGLGYSLVGQAAPESLRPIANEVRKQAGSI